MVIGASMAGGRVMTSSSSPGISLMQEGISFLAGLELPAVVANMMRGGSPNISQRLMRWRVLLQFVAIVIIMVTIWVMRR